MAEKMEVGLSHPPVGLNLYVASGITKMGIGELKIAVLPWLLTMLGFPLIVTFVPEISLRLPRQLGFLYLDGIHGAPQTQTKRVPAREHPAQRRRAAIEGAASG